MNKTGIEWCDYTWNPVTGCTRGCSYCYARRMAQRLRGRAGYPQDDPFRPTFHMQDSLIHPGKGSRIFVCSMGELFSPDVPDEWVENVLKIVRLNDQHTYIFLTKNPRLLAKWNPWPSNAWVGMSATNMSQIGDIPLLAEVDAKVRFVSFEPLLEYTPPDLRKGWCVQWIIIGIQSGPGAREHWPSIWEIDDLVYRADQAGTPVFMKRNLLKAFPDMVLRQEWPLGDCRNGYPSELSSPRVT